MSSSGNGSGPQISSFPGCWPLLTMQQHYMAALETAACHPNTPTTQPLSRETQYTNDRLALLNIRHSSLPRMPAQLVCSYPAGPLPRVVALPGGHTCTGGTREASSKSRSSRLTKALIREGAVPGGPRAMRQMALSFTAPSNLWGIAVNGGQVERHLKWGAGRSSDHRD